VREQVSESWLSERNSLVSLYAQRGKTAISLVSAPFDYDPAFGVYECKSLFVFAFDSFNCCCCSTQLKFSFLYSFILSFL